MSEHTGEMDLPFSEVGSVVQALVRVLVDRGHDEDIVRSRLLSWARAGNEFDWWENNGGPLVDELENLILEDGELSKPIMVCVEYKVSVFAYAGRDEDGEWSMHKVVVDDENLGEPVYIEYDGGEDIKSAMLAAEALHFVDVEAEWPGWEFGW